MEFPAASNKTNICAARSSSLIKQSPKVGDVEGTNDGLAEGNWVWFWRSSNKSSVKLEEVG